MLVGIVCPRLEGIIGALCQRARVLYCETAVPFCRPFFVCGGTCVQVIGNVTPDMHIVREEVFGPVVVVYTFKDEVGW